MTFKELDAKMRVYEQSLDQIIPPENYLLARIDGRSFTRLTREICKFEKPFDDRFSQMMVETVKSLVTDTGMEIIYGYTQSDEISLLFSRDAQVFGRKVRKLNSILAGTASAKFTLLLGQPAVFDCRIIPLPNQELVTDYYSWRMEDAHRNCLNSWCYWTLRKEGWSAYRYAIGITEYPHRNGLSEAERYRMFRDIEFNTPEFQALSAAFTDFLKRKKITDVVALRDQYRENDLIWLSRNYAMGRHSYAASHCNDILSYSNDVLSPERKEFMARDIRSQITDHLRWHSFFIPRELEETYSPLDLFLQFITENNIDSDEKYQEYSRIDVYLSSDGQISFATEKKEHNKSYFSFMSDIDDYLGWDQLASFFFPPCHKKCRIRFNGQESIIPYINSWSRIYYGSGNYRYERVKIPIDKLPNQFVRTYINQDYIVEDNIL